MYRLIIIMYLNELLVVLNTCIQTHIDNKKTKTNNSESILLVFLYAKFGIAIFMTFRLSNIANATEANENAIADINIILNEVADGK